MAARNLLGGILALVAVGFASPNADARTHRLIPCEELWSASDLVVIARPVTKTRDTDERTYFPGVVSVHPDGTESRVRAVGVETTFKVMEVLKGDFAEGRQLTLHHFRPVPEAAPDGRIVVEMNGPTAMSFDPSDETFQLFLIKEKDGRYAPYSGQTDPDFRWIRGIGGPVFCSPPGWARHEVRLAPLALPTLRAH